LKYFRKYHFDRVKYTEKDVNSINLIEDNLVNLMGVFHSHKYRFVFVLILSEKDKMMFVSTCVTK